MLPLAVTLLFTMPCTTALPGDCTDGLVPLDDLDSAFVYARAPGGPAHITYRLDASPYACWTFTCPAGAVLPGDSVWIVTSDFAGNRSCRSNVVIFGSTAAVEPQTASAPDRWYDVAGRRVEPPRMPGWYILRRGDAWRRVVVLR